MTTWVIISWVFVAILTGVNVFFFMKVIYPSMKMMKSMGGGQNMDQMMAQAQKMMGGMGGPGAGRGGMPPNMEAMMAQMNNPKMQQQMKQAMEVLGKMQQNGKGPRR